MEQNNCRICGLYIADFPWGEDGNSPTYQICSCCGVEFGNEDYTTESIKRYRQEWIKKGAKWFNLGEKPENWNLEKQLKSIPNEFM
jgi:hypothetical protein